VVRAVLGWGILSFAVLQIYEPVMHGLHLPEWTLTLVVVVLGVGFPATFVLAWIFDMGPGGVERTPSAPGEVPTAARRVRTALLLIGLGLLISVPGWAWYARHDSVRSAAPSSDGGSAPGQGSPVATGGPSIAVLPFTDMSPQHDQEYFSDGIAEEILNALAQVEGLRVSGRTSSFSFKGRADDLRAIGQRLGVGTVLEGSVRKAGGRIRITAQLVKTADGFHLWSQTFDRDLTDVFAVQDEIARAVVAALRLKLLPGQAAPARSIDLRAHDLYLLGVAHMSKGTGQAYGEAVQAFRKAVEIEPGYALAWAAISTALFYHADQGAAPGVREREFPEALAAADRAVALAPDLAQGYRARSLVREAIQQDWAGAQADIDRARTLSPQNPDVLGMQASLLAQAGRLPEAIAADLEAASVDPLSPEIPVGLSAVYLGTGQLELAEAAARRALGIAPNHGQGARNLGFALLLQGRLQEARAAFHRSSNEFFHTIGDAMVDHSVGDAATAQRSLDVMLARPTILAGSYQAAQVYAWRGEIDKAFEWLGSAADHHDAGLVYVKFDPFLKPLRGDPRYAALLKKLNVPVN
jgi:TolB-like protein